MTSLAAQLKKLAVPETQSLLTGDLRQDSFLYDEGQAATFDKQHFYNIGVNGLLQLIEKDSRFSEYEQTLFSPSSQSLQRFVQTTEVNSQLDASISTFLLQLSPYMQLREAHKAMEWMVHRYKVHLRNVNALMMCVLPYHDQEPFVHALRLLKLSSQECAMWRWLEPVKKGGMFLPTATLVTHCRSAKGFLGFLCDMLRKHIQANTDDMGSPLPRQLQRIITFYTQTVLGVCMAGPPSEGHITVLIPAVSAGLRSHVLPDHMASSYMILSQLFSQVSLDGAVLESLLNVLAKNAQSSLFDEAMAVVVLMFQTQAISKVSKKAYKYLSRQANLIPVLGRLSRDAQAEPFLVPLVKTVCQRLLRSRGSDASSASDSNAEDTGDAVFRPPLSLLLDLLASVSVKRNTVHAITSLLFDWCTEHLDTLKTDIQNESMPAHGVFRVFRHLEHRFSEALDSTTNELCASDSSGRIKSVLEALYELSVQVAKDDLKSNPLSSLTVCLHHRDSGVRKNAVQRLMRECGLQEDIGDVQATLSLRLQDDDPEVVKAMLQQSEVLWSVCGDKALLHQTLMKKYQSMEDNEESAEVSELLLQALLCAPFDAYEEGPLHVLALSALVVTQPRDLPRAKAVFSTNFGLSDPLLECLAQEWLPSVEKLKGKDAVSLNTPCKLLVSLADSITTHLCAQKPERCLNFLKTLHSCLANSPQPARAACLALLVGQGLIGKVKSSDTKVQVQRHLMAMAADFTTNKSLVKSKRPAANKEERPQSRQALSRDSVLSECLNCVGQSGRLTQDFVLYLLAHMDWESTPPALQGKGFMLPVTCEESDRIWLDTMIQAFTFLLKVSASKRSHPLTGDIFAQIHGVMGNAECMLRLVCTILVSEAVSGEDKALCLNFAQVYLSALPQGVRAKLATHPTPALPCLLLLLSNPLEKVREVAFCLMSGLYEGLSPETLNAKWFVDRLLRYREEVLKDQDFLAQCLKNILEGDDTTLPTSPKRRRKSSSKLSAPSVALGSLLDLLSDPSTPPEVKAGLLATLARLDTAESFIPLIQLLKQLVPSKASSPQPTNSEAGPMATVSRNMSDSLMIGHLLKRYTPTVAGCVEENTECITALLACLQCVDTLTGSKYTVQLLALEQLSGQFMGSLPLSSRKAVFKTLLSLVVQSSDTAVQRKCRKVIKHMILEANIVNEELRQISKTTASSVREAKQKKAKIQGEDLALDSVPWQRVKCLLEMVQNKKKMTRPVLLVPEAFAVLARLLEVEEKGSGEYLKQLLLGTISNICGRHQEKTGDEEEDEDNVVRGEHLNMELIVQCIRGSDNPHTHHQALILLSQAAKIAPDLLLHNMMSVFTFMGANILRQDDAYSFHVIARILENVIPALRMACEEKSKPQGRSRRRAVTANPVGSEVIMTVVLRVFVDAIPHIPAHRKMAVFGKLLSVVGVQEHLWRLLLLLMERVTMRGAKDGEQEEEQEGEKLKGPVAVADMEFLLSLSEEFSCTQLLSSFTQALAYLFKLPEDKTGDVLVPRMTKDFSLTELSDNDREIFSVAHHSAKQLRHFKYASVHVLRELVSSQHFIAQMSAMETSEFQGPFQELMETTLQLIGRFTQSHDQASSLPAQKAKFWRVLLHKAHDLLDGMMQLLPDSVFLQVCTGLMAHPLPLVQRRALELLNGKLAQYRDQPVRPDQFEQLSGLVPSLSDMVSQTLLKGKRSQGSEEELVIGQLSLYSLKVLCRCLGSRHNFLQVLELCISVLSRQHTNGIVCASAMLCSAEVVSTAGAHALEHLTRLMPLIVDQLQADSITQHEVLLVSSLTCVQKIMEAVPQFLSPYLQALVVQVCLISAGSHRAAVAQKVKAICTSVATVTPTRSFLPILEKSLTALGDRLPSCAACALAMLKEHVVHMPREDLSTFSHDLLNFFLLCLDLRVTQPQLCGADLDAVEDCVIDAFIALVFKLSEAQFKPMLIQLYTWAIDEDQSKDRVLVFYKLCDRLAQKLKSLFTLFAGHILKHCTQVMDANNKSKGKCRYFGSGKMSRRKGCDVLVSVLGCVHSTLAYDTDGFLNKERFDLLMQPLVDQLENQLGKPSVCEVRMTQHLVPCLANLAAAAQDDTLWKDLNYQILLKTRHEDPKVRIWALSAIDALHKQLGEDYTQLVPETIPFMAELMEDDSDEVEKHTHKVLAAMEVSVGENLQEYF